MLRVKAIPGEPTRFWVESNTLVCTSPECSRTYNRKQRHRLVPNQSSPTDYLHIGDPCPVCGATLDVRFHVVDIASNNCNGQCGCEFFSFTHAPALAKLLPSDRGMGKHRCSHIEAARQFALDVALHGHEYERYKDAGRQREEAQP